MIVFGAEATLMAVICTPVADGVAYGLLDDMRILRGIV